MKRVKQETIGQIIKIVREKAKISQTDLARLSGVSLAYVSRLEGNERENISIKLLDNIFNALNVSIQDVLSNYNSFFKKSNKASDTYLNDIVEYINSNEVKFENNVIDDMKKEALIDLIHKINDSNVNYSEILSVVEEYQSL